MKSDFVAHHSDQRINADVFAKSKTRNDMGRNLPESVSTVLPAAQRIIITESQGPISKSSMSLIRNRKGFVYLIGEVTYRDVFGKQHRTEVCGILDHTGLFAACEQHNYAD